MQTRYRTASALATASLLTLPLVLGACANNANPSPVSGTAAVTPSPETDTSVQWPAYNRTAKAWRFAPSAQITPRNAASLEVVCEYDTGETTSFQTSPLVVEDVMYFTTEKGTYAVDARDCSEIWTVRADYEPVSPLKVNRGAAFMDGRLFRGYLDGRVVALDAATGRQLWDVQLGVAEKGESVPAAPIAHNGRVFIGNAGGDNYGVKGRMYAFDAATGAPLWETFLVPREGAADAQPVSVVEAPISTDVTDDLRPDWGNDAGIPITGGATWVSYSLDRERGRLYVPAGNPAPDFIPGMREGDNLLTNTITVLDTRTGAYLDHFELVPADFHDWDSSAPPAVVRTRGGRDVLVSAVKDGILRVHDEASGRKLVEMPITSQFNTTAPLTTEGTRFCPGSQGGVEWNGPAYSPVTNYAYTGAVDWCTTVTVKTESEAASVAMGQPWSGSADEENIFGEFDPKEAGRGWIYAVDVDTGHEAWRWEAPTPLLAGLVPTGGGVLFTGDLNGDLHAFDERDGTHLESWSIGGPIGGGVIGYAAEGRQLVAVTSGMNSAIWPWKGGTAKVTVVGLPQ